MTKIENIEAIRAFLQSLDPKASSSAASPLPLNDLYAPPAHANALDPNRPLVVGNRGVGKSVWSGVLADEELRNAVASAYPKLNMRNLVVELGFHEAAGKVAGVAPSPKVLASLLKKGFAAEDIWQAVLLRAIAGFVNFTPHETLAETISWMADSVEDSEALLRKADTFFSTKGTVFLLVFDALDVLGNNWPEIRPLTEGILKLALGMQGYKSMRAKVFMRTDQIKDTALFQFADASKMRAGRVELAWHATELYGLLFNLFHNNDNTRIPFNSFVKNAIGKWANPDNIDGRSEQAAVFSALAGEFMGSDHRRGRTYTWLIDHLADAFGETTPRSFLIALQRAAISRTRPTNLVIDYFGIREGVQAASAVRVDQLQEDYPWIRNVLADLEGLEVPCQPSMFIGRWKEQKTIASLSSIMEKSQRPGPIELEGIPISPEAALIEALMTIGVVEERSADRINMPDIFRVAAKIKRRGGVRPPVAGNKSS